MVLEIKSSIKNLIMIFHFTMLNTDTKIHTVSMKAEQTVKTPSLATVVRDCSLLVLLSSFQ